MKLTVQLTSHAEPSRGETDRLAEMFTVEFRRNGDARDEFLKSIAASIKRIAEKHNAKFEAEHGG
jgi:hypothetical protein